VGEEDKSFLLEKHFFQKNAKNNKIKVITQTGLIKESMILASKNPKKRKEKLTQDMPTKIFQKIIIAELIKIA
jgi:ABC-type phosphate/phosphonate transport system substrate-binding protein